MPTPLPSTQSDINHYVLSEVSAINGRLGAIEGDIKIVKGYIKGQAQAKQAKHSYIREITLLGISAGIAAVISFMTGYRS